MSELWTDLIDPATLTGYARAALQDLEAAKGSLARWLPNRYIEDIIIRFAKGETGLIDIAKWRAYDAELEPGKRRKVSNVTLELPALGQTLPVSEYEQLRARSGNVTDEQALRTILATTTIVVKAVAEAAEYLRGVVLATGRATITQDNFQIDDNFGRSSGHQLTASSPWTTSGVDRLEYLDTILDVYRETNGENPGVMLFPTRAFRALASGDQFQTQLLNGGARNATTSEVNALIESSGYPPIELYDRSVSIDGTMTRVLPNHSIILLPAPVDTEDAEGTDLGGTTWGRTLTATEPDWGIEDSEQPGIVAGVYRNKKPPMGIEVLSDAIALPHLANADRSLVAKVLP